LVDRATREIVLGKTSRGDACEGIATQTRGIEETHVLVERGWRAVGNGTGRPRRTRLAEPGQTRARCEVHPRPYFVGGEARVDRCRGARVLRALGGDRFEQLETWLGVALLRFGRERVEDLSREPRRTAFEERDGTGAFRFAEVVLLRRCLRPRPLQVLVE